MRLPKDESRKRWFELRKAVNIWDPESIIQLGAPDDEYECMVGPIIRMLERSATPDEIAHYLDLYISDHFGGRKPKGSLKFAEKIVDWFTEHWKGTRV